MIIFINHHLHFNGPFFGSCKLDVGPKLERTILTISSKLGTTIEALPIYLYIYIYIYIYSPYILYSHR